MQLHYSNFFKVFQFFDPNDSDFNMFDYNILVLIVNQLLDSMAYFQFFYYFYIQFIKKVKEFGKWQILLERLHRNVSEATPE